MYIEIIVRNFSARTAVNKSENGKIMFNQCKHFPLRVPRSRAHPSNLVQIHLIGTHDTERVNIGSLSFHLHDIIKGSPLAGKFNIQGQHLEKASLNLEITFNYGIFGYGNSLQLMEPQSVADEFVQYSLLPRMNPPSDKCRPGDNVLAVQAVPHPKFIPFEEKVFLSYGKEFKKELNELGDSLYQPQNLMRDYEKMSQVRRAVKRIDIVF